MMARPVPAAEARDPASVGGKAAALGRLVAAGFDVPSFFALPPECFTDRGLRPELRPALTAAVAALGGDRFAVRSSGREEDGSAHSHAGQFLTRLEVAAADVEAAAHEVWRSGLAGSVAAYRASRGLEPGGDAPAVMVQRMVAAHAAGVAFSADPVSGRRDRVVVSAIAGLGDRLVGGEVDGDGYTLAAADGALIAGPAGGGVLGAGDLAKVHALVARVAADLGAAVDIEWALEGDRLYLLQARPITTPLRPTPAADPAVAIFDNSNIVESYPGLVSPLTYSFAQYVYARVYRTFVALVGVPADRIAASGAVFENMLGRVDGRVYYNLVNWYRALALLPGFALNRRHMETMMGVAEPLPDAIADALLPPPARGLARLREQGRVARVGVRLAWHALRLKSTVAAFNRRLDRALATDRAAIERMPLSALAAEYRRIEADLLERWDAPLVNDFLCMVAFGASRKLMQRWLGAAGLALHNDIMIGQGDIVSAEPAQRIRRMGALAAGNAAVIEGLAAGRRAAASAVPALEREIADYIARFGDRCTEELKLESLTLEEEPAPLLAAIAAAAAAGHTAPRRLDDPMARLAGMLGSKPVRRAVLSRLVGWAKARVRDRENLRFERTRIFGHARRVVLAMGRELHALGAIEGPRDIFHLTIAEVLGAVEGFAVTHDLAGLAALRKAEMARAAERPDPPARITLSGAVVTARPAAASTAAAAADTSDIRSGTGCSAGKMTARARVVTDPRRQSLAPGEILVARHTDPGWIAVFTNAAAIVVERGSLLSHSAIVARELAIPCVVGLKGATTWIADGDTIEVDGATGTVRKVHG